MPKKGSAGLVSVQDKPNRIMKLKLYGLFFLAMVLGMIYVTAHMYKVTVRKSEKYQELANNQQFRSTTIRANRGPIYDRNGQVLAQSVTVYTIFVDPRTFAERDMGTDTVVKEKTADGKETEYKVNREQFIIDTLSEALDVAPEKIKELLYKNNAYQEIKTGVEKPISDDIMNKMAAMDITSVGSTPTPKRYYPQGDLAANVIGHLHYDGYGIYGLEAYYNDYLTGTNGRIISAKDAHGAEFQYKYKQSYGAKDGDTIYTNIDATIQYYVEKALESAVKSNVAKFKGSAIVMNCKTGAVLAMATDPDYDLNEPARVYDENKAKAVAELKKQWEINKSDKEREKAYITARSNAWNLQWTNKAISSLYFPGSVFKVITGSAALEEDAISLSDTFHCNGSVKVSGQDLSCWTTHGGHGTQNFVKAMTNSCNPAFVNIGQKLGAKAFCDYFKAFGLTEKTGIDLPAETSSIYVPYSRMTLLDLSVSSFGQANKITPLQMITAYAAVVNGGYLVTPYIVDKIVDCDGNVVKQFQPTIKRQVISEETSQIMRQTLETVVTANSKSNAYIKGYHIGGKSGTSQKLDENPKGDTYVSSYCAFYPADDPEIIMLVMIDEPTNGLYYGSAVAAPVVSEAFTEILPYLGYYAEYTEEELEDLAVNVPSVEGASLEKAKSTIKSLGFEIDVIGKGDTVVKQVPSRGNQMPKGCKVIVYTEENYEEDMVFVPDLTGYSLSKANQKLASLGLNLMPLGGAAQKAGAQCSGVMNYKEQYVKKGTIIEAYFLVNDETG